MRTILHIIRKEFFQLRRDPRMLTIVIIAPIIQLMFLGYAATLDVKDIPVVVCDMDNSRASREFVEQVSNSGYFTVEYRITDIDAVDSYLDDNKAVVAIVIPRGFGNKLQSGVPAPLQILVDGANSNTAAISLSYIRGMTERFSRMVLADAAERRGGQTVRIPRVAPEVRAWFNPELRSRNFMVPSVIALILMIVTVTLTSLGLVKEKEIGTLEQLMVTPIKPYQLIIGKLLPFVIIGFIDICLVLLVAAFWFGVPVRGSVLLLFGLSTIFILTTLGLGLFVSTVSRTQQQAMMTAQFFIMMPFIYFSGFIFPIENMPVIVQYITYVVPLRYFITIIRGIFLKGVGISVLWPQALALLIFGVAIFSFSVLRFRKRLE
jgi:ABC-2 type transport system permease protein